VKGFTHYRRLVHWNQVEPSQAPLVVIAGPTGSGKSELALRVAETYSGEIVNCDSVQVYRHFRIGAAKLAPAERRGVPHHLIDAIEPGEPFSAGDYSRLARRALAEITARSRLPVVAGGTGFYLRALLDGLFAGPVRDERLRARLAARQARRPGSLHRLLRRFDPVSAARIHPNDASKLIRALEVILLERRPLSQLFQAGRDRLAGYRALKLALDPPRQALYARLDRRVERMYRDGLVDETRAILERGYPRAARPFESLGYKQALMAIDGRIGIDAAIADTKLATRRYAKRQWTWLRREPDLEWTPGFGDDPLVQQQVLARVAEFLAE
jgi:tRNA dimethylallyltransferase